MAKKTSIIETAEPYAMVMVRVDNQKDLEDFAKLINQPKMAARTSRKQFTWYPLLAKGASSVFLEEDNEEL